jgi:hypothetical protein
VAYLELKNGCIPLSTSRRKAKLQPIESLDEYTSAGCNQLPGTSRTNHFVDYAGQEEVNCSSLLYPIHPRKFQMFKRNCVVKYVDSFGVERAAKVEAESLFEAAVRGLHKLDSSFWTEEDVWERMCITVEVHEEPTIHTVTVENLKRWVRSHGKHPREQAKKEELRKLLFGPGR